MTTKTFEQPHVSLVTGASTGIGAATAVALARAGSRVAVHYYSSEEAARQVAETIAKAGGEARLFRADLSLAAEARRLVDEVEAAMGRVDALVNNAGSMIGRKTLSEVTEDYWRTVVDTNVSSVLWVTQAAAPGMARRGGGAVINVSSVAARNGGSVGVIAYASAKGAVLTMTKALAKELIASNIRVNGVNPGIILTPFHERFTGPERLKALVANVPQGRAGTAEEVAAVIVFLASPAASHLVGESIEINGGMWMD